MIHWQVDEKLAMRWGPPLAVFGAVLDGLGNATVGRRDYRQATGHRFEH